MKIPPVPFFKRKRLKSDPFGWQIDQYKSVCIVRFFKYGVVDHFLEIECDNKLDKDNKDI